MTPEPTPRRRFLIGVAASFCAGSCCRSALAATPVLKKVVERGGCALHAGELEEIEASAAGAVDFGGKAMIPSSGDPKLDRALGAALVRMSQLFEERPGFAFFDDSAAPNAYATTDTRVEGTWGTVLFGKKLFWELVTQNDDQGIAVTATIAHEFAHILQFRRDLRPKLMAGQRSVKRMELHADYLAGYYLGARKRDNPSISLLASGALFRFLGDLHTESRSHHGTPDERIESAELGFKLGIKGDSLDQAVSQGLRYALSL